MVEIRTLGELVDDGLLPSGHRFELQPDTVENALRVAEVQDSQRWREKLLQVGCVLKSIDGKSVQELAGQAPVADFLGGLLDADVVFAALAWSSELNGRSLKMQEPIPCPHCGGGIMAIDMAPLKIAAYSAPVAGGDAFVEVPIDAKFLPEHLRQGRVLAKAPTWLAARSKVPHSGHDKYEVVVAHRAMAAMHHDKGEGTPRALSRAEASKLPMRALQAVIACMDEHFPRVMPSMTITCAGCHMGIDVPFEQAGG